jgi:alkylation response protein AidB-like acyl-CoA dehydrogenase
LIEHQVIRHKISEMIAKLEAVHTLTEYATFQVLNNVRGDVIGGLIALLKVQATKVLEFCAREASQILGGNSQLKSGPGERIERIYRDVRTAAIGGGSEGKQKCCVVIFFFLFSH